MIVIYFYDLFYWPNIFLFVFCLTIHYRLLSARDLKSFSATSPLSILVIAWKQIKLIYVQFYISVFSLHDYPSLNRYLLVHTTRSTYHKKHPPFIHWSSLALHFKLYNYILWKISLIHSPLKILLSDLFPGSSTGATSISFAAHTLYWLTRITFQTKLSLFSLKRLLFFHTFRSAFLFKRCFSAQFLEDQ